MPYASWPGRWQMKVTSPGSSKVRVVSSGRRRRDRDLGRDVAVRRLGPVPVPLVERRVADEPLVVDRVRR